MRIVTHTCSNTEIVAALGLGDWIVGVDDHSDFPVEVVQRAAKIGPDNNIDVEKVAALKPDLVLTSRTIPGHDQCIERLRARGLPHMVMEPTRLSHVPRDIRRIAETLGVPDCGESLASRMEAELKATHPSDRPGVLVEWWPKPVIVPGRDSWVTQMLDLAGGYNPWADVPDKSVPLTAEDDKLAQVEHIVIAWCGVPFDKYRPQVVLRREHWQHVPAIARQSIHPISESVLGRPGPRLIDGLKQLKRICATARGL